MTVGQLIEELRKFPAHLPVCLEGYREPSEAAAETISLDKDSWYWATGSSEASKGDYVCLGD